MSSDQEINTLSFKPGDEIIHHSDRYSTEEKKYIFIDYIGEGSFGHVCKCYDQMRQCEVALKILKNNEDDLKQGFMELSALYIVCYNNI